MEQKMARRNISDIIESYLKDILSEGDSVEIRRKEMAEHFDCVPSQINYVINTRFTLQQGYLVESKRGGGGYIRIREVNLLEESKDIDTMVNTIIGNSISERDAQGFIKGLYAHDLISKREGDIMLSAIDSRNFQVLGELTDMIRARILKSMLVNLLYD